MRRRMMLQWTVAGLGSLLAAGGARADALPFTGDVEVDFPLFEGSGVVAIVDNPGPDGVAGPLDVAQNASLPGITGWNIKDLRLAYDDATDTMAVGVNFFTIAGDADADGHPGVLSASAGRDEPSLGGLESITVAIDSDLDGTPDIVAGVPGLKTGANPGPGVDHFTVADYRRSTHGLAFSFGETLTEHLGALAFDPSAEHPDFEFSINNFKKLPGLVPEDGFIISAFAGTSADVIAGEDFIAQTRIAFPGVQEQQIPEPAALVGWAMLVGGAAAWRVRRSRDRRHRRSGSCSDRAGTGVHG